MENSKDHKHHIIYILLAIIIVLLLSRDKTGRYAISEGPRGMYVLDTKTSQLWKRIGGSNQYWGTNEKPMAEIISSRVKVETFEEIK